MAVLTTSYQKLGEAYLGNSGGSLYIRIYVKYSEQDIINNRSKVQYQARAYFSGSYIYDQQSSGNVRGTSATQVNFSKNTNYNNGETTLGTTEGWVSHDNDGKASVTGYAYLNFPNWSWSATASGSADLPTIPRGSTITATSAYIGETSQLTVTRYNNNYTHSIKYTFGSLNGYILANGTTTSTETKITATSIGFPLPSTWYAQIPNAQSGTCTLTIKTYNGNTQVGDAKTTTFVARVNASTNSPTVTSSVSDINDTTYALTGNRNILVKGYSTAQITWSATAKNNATISNVKINGATVTTSPTNITPNSNSISVIATDSRGLATTSNPSFTFKNYAQPNHTITAVRVSPTSDYANVSFKGTWFNQSFGSQSNTLTIIWYYREHGTSNWTNGGTLTQNTHYKIDNNGNFWSGTGSSMSAIQLGGSLLYAKSWDIAINAVDKLATKSIQTTITQGIPIINWGSDFFNVNGDIRHNDSSLITYLDDKLEYYNNTTASNWQDLVKKKLDLLVTKTASQQNTVMFINGGWSGVNYLWTIGSKKGNCYDVAVFTDKMIYLGRLYNSNYSYRVIHSNYYSTTEQEIGIWTDGKPIYRKVLGSVGALGNGATKHFSVSSLNIAQVIKIDGYLKYSNQYITTVNRITNYHNTSTGNITLYNGENMAINDGLVYIEYTKT